jgi:SSS family solute:Na+ symporter
VGILSGFLLSVLFNNYAPAWFGNETLLYTAYPNGKGGFEIPFLVTMGWAFFLTVLLMVVISLAGPKINPKSFELDRSMFKLKPSTIIMITMIIMILIALYAKFW